MVRKQGNRTKQLRRQFRPVLYKRCEQFPPGWAVFAQRPNCVIQGSLQNDCCSIVERMRERGIGLNPLQSVFVEWERGEKWRCDRHRVDCRTKIVQKTRQREWQSTSGASGFRFSLEDVNFEPGLRQHNGCGEAIWARTDDVGTTLHSLDPIAVG